MMQRIRESKGIFLALLFFVMLLLFSSCTRTLGYGVLFWSSEDPQIPSGTVLRVYIRSNINRVWVAGIPRELRAPENPMTRFEVPLSHMELVGSRRRAHERAAVFAPYALVYAETLQDGLPIRESPDNVSRRVYRLREGEVVKILHPVRGQAVIGAAGTPLPGEWFRVLTADGTAGYCFSYRLRLFEHTGGSLDMARHGQQDMEDPDLDSIFTRVWSPESYAVMVNTRRINLEEFAQRWHFDPGQDTGTARIRTGDVDLAFPFTQIRANGTRSWNFEGSTLQMSLRPDNALTVQFNEPGGIHRTLVFSALHSSVDNIIHQETVRREALFRNIYQHSAEFTSTNFGTLTLQEDGRFTWTGNMLLVPQVIPVSAMGSGTIDMGLSLSNAMAAHHTGAFTMLFDGIGGARIPVNFMYTLDPHGLRIEHAPQTSMDGLTVVRRASSPQVVNFFRVERPDANVFDFSSPFDTTDQWDMWDSSGLFDVFDFDLFDFDLTEDGVHGDFF